MTMSSQPELTTADEYPAEILPFLPLLYVVWEDGVLGPHEIAALRRRLDSAASLSEDGRRILTGFLDPEHPPTAGQLRSWRRISEHKLHAGSELPRNLTELGTQVAPTDLEVRRTLEAAEVETGVIGREAVRSIAATYPNESEKPEPPSSTATTEAPFDTKHLLASMYGEQLGLRGRTLSLVASPSFQNVPEHDVPAYREWVMDRIRDLAQAGLGAIAFPVSCGGGGDMRGFITVFETLALHDVSLVIKYGVQFGLFGGSIQQLGTSDQWNEVLPRIGRAELPGCFAMTETGHGSNVRDIRTTATFEPSTDSFVITTPSRSAWKDYIGNAALHGRLATVFAQLIVAGESVGVHAFMVPIRDGTEATCDGVRIEDCGRKMGLNGVDNGRIEFTEVRVPRTALLSRFGIVDETGQYRSDIPSDGKRFFTMLGTLVGGRVSVGLAALSAAKTGLTIAIRYAVSRRQFGPRGEPEVPILDYLTHQRRLLPLVADAYALHFALHELADRYVEAADDEERMAVEVLASGLKARSTRSATDTLQTVREACGGQGYLWENRFAALKADTDVFTTFEGDNTVLLLQVAKSLLGDYGQQFSNMDVFGYVRHIARIAAQNVVDRNPIASRQTDSDHLRDPDNVESALRYRTETLLRSVARRMKHRLDNGVDSFEAFIECQDHLLELAQAHVDLEVFGSFRTAIDAAPADSREWLQRLLALFGLCHLERNRGWFLEQNYFEGAKAKAIRREVNVLLGEIRPHAVAFTDAFGIPDETLRAPIAVQ